MTVTIDLRPDVAARLQRSAKQRGLSMQDYIQQLIEMAPTEKAEAPAPLPAETMLRPFGLCAGEFTVPDDFDAPLPDDIQEIFSLSQQPVFAN